MYSIIGGCLIIVLFASLLISGLFSYYKKNEETYSFLNEFPYELNTNNNLLFNILASLLGASISVFGILKFLFLNINGVKLISDYISGTLLIIIGILIFLIFVITLKQYKGHLIVVSLLFSFTVINYAYIGINIFLDKREIFNTSLGYIFIVLAIISLIGLISAPLNRWMYLEKHEEGSVTTYNRSKVSILPLLEWIFIGLNIILIILLMIN